MKRLFFILLCCLFMFFIICKCDLIKTKADNETTDEINLFEDFIYDDIDRCYYCYPVDNVWQAELRLLLFRGTNNGNDAYILYDEIDNEVIEYSFNSRGLWGTQGRFVDIFLFFSGNYYGGMNSGQLADKDSPKTITIFHGTTVESIDSNYLYKSLNKQIDYCIEENNFNYTENVVKQHTIENDFYFTNLNNNYGDNLYHTCGYISTLMLLSYAHEFYDSNIIPDILTCEIAGNTVTKQKQDMYNKTYKNDYNIKNFESPGANEEFQQFLIKYYHDVEELNPESDYTFHGSDFQQMIEKYFNTFYNGDIVGLRKVSDFRKEMSVSDYYNSTEFSQSYEYYESCVDRTLLYNEDIDEEYELDIVKELDNNNPVIIYIDGSEPLLLNLEKYDGSTIQELSELPTGHAMIAYGYVETETGLYYKCHFGRKEKNGNYTNNEIYIKALNIVKGFVFKPFSTPTEQQQSSYYYDNNGCMMNLPTNNVYETYEDFAVDLGNVEYDDEKEYYYCNCEEPHLLYQQNHNMKYRNLDDNNHQKFCDCGYQIEENHETVHTDATCVEHYAYCIYCSFTDYHADGISYAVGEDPNLVPEHYHTWTCTECNLSGAWTHTLECTSLGSQHHYLECKLCEYAEAVPHGIGFNIELWYQRIDENSHEVYCIGCGERWIEEHINCDCW